MIPTVIEIQPEISISLVVIHSPTIVVDEAIPVPENCILNRFKSDDPLV
jgi:hypothetical protein